MAKLMPDTNNQVKNCSLCESEFIKVPKLLECFHSFCKECLQKKIKDLDVGDSLPCPKCSLTMTVPKGGVDGLPNDFLEEAKLQLQLFRDSDVKFCNVCEYLGEKSPALYYCINCQYHLCERDEKRHKATPSQRDHCVISCEEMNAGKYDPEIVAATLGNCQQHSSESVTKPLTFYCEECEILACQECIVATHKGHELTAVKKVSNEYHSKIADIFEKVCSAKEVENETMKNVQRDIDDLNEEKKKVVSEIEKRGKYLMTAIEDAMTKMIAEVNMKYSAEEKKCESVQNILNDKRLCVENMASFIKQCMDYSSDVFIITHQKEITRKSQVCLERLQLSPEAPPLRAYAFVSKVDNLPEVQLRRLLGEIKEEMQDEQETSTEYDSSDDMYENIDTMRSMDNKNYSSFVQTRSSMVDENRALIGQPSYLYSLALKKNILTLEKQWKIRGIFDVTVPDTGDIIISTPSTVQKLVNGTKFETILSFGSDKVYGVQHYKNDIYIPANHNQGGFITSDINGIVRRLHAVPKQKRYGICGIGVDVNDGTVFWGSDNGKLYRFDFPYSEEGQMLAKKLDTPTSICFDKDGNCIIADRGRNCVFKLDRSENEMWRYGKRGSDHGEFDGPRGVCTDDYGNIYVADRNNHRIHKLSPDGAFICYLSMRNSYTGDNQIASPNGLHFRQGRLYVASKSPDMLTVYRIH